MFLNRSISPEASMGMNMDDGSVSGPRRLIEATSKEGRCATPTTAKAKKRRMVPQTFTTPFYDCSKRHAHQYLRLIPARSVPKTIRPPARVADRR